MRQPVLFLTQLLALFIALCGALQAQVASVELQRGDTGGSGTTVQLAQQSEYQILLAAGIALERSSRRAMNVARWQGAENHLADPLYRFIAQVRDFNWNLADLISRGEVYGAVRRLAEHGRRISNVMRGSAISKQVAEQWSRVQRQLTLLERLAAAQAPQLTL